MDVDSDLDGKLLQQFSSMGTTDKEVLVSEFQRLLGTDLNPDCCAFFLDMNNWNLQAAICSYYDYEQPNVRVPCMSFIGDVTVGEGESVPPSTQFIKTWRIKNSGEDSWPPGCCLKFCSGENLSNRERVIVDSLGPGEMTDISVEMLSPHSTGLYQGQWRMCTATGLCFGEVIWVIITVEAGGLLGLTQQLSKFGDDLSHPVQTDSVANPFASPQKLSECASNCGTPPNNCFSLNSSLIAQHGSPFPSQLSPISPNSNPATRHLFPSLPESDSQAEATGGITGDTEMS